MTVTSTTTRNSYIGTGATGPFAFTFRIVAATDLRVTTRAAATGLETTLAYPAQYSVTGAGDAGGGSITLTTALATGDTLTIRRVRPLTQPTSFRNQGAFFPATHEDALDHQIMVAQQQQDELARAARLPETVDPADVDPALPVPVAGRILGWNNSGTGIENRAIDASADVALPGAGRTVATLTDYLSNNADFNVRDYGASALGTAADNTTAINLAIAQAAAAGGGVVRIPPRIAYNQATVVLDAAVEVVDDSRAAPRRTGRVLPWSPDASTIEIIAHRGGALHAPENTLAAFGYATGRAHSAELDIDFSSDNQPVVFHDFTVDRTTDGTGDVTTLTFDQLRALDAGSYFDARFAGARIATLKEALAFCAPRFRWVYAELKRDCTEGQVALAVDAVLATRLEDRCIMPSFYAANFPRLRAYSKRITAGYECLNVAQWNLNLPLAEADGNAIIICDYNILLDDPEKVKQARARGVDVAVYLVDTLDVVLQLVAIGVTRYISDTLVNPQVTL